jgi:endonuclease YncB( thermonuclease family)
MFEDCGSHTPEFTLVGVETIARVVNVLDGDSIVLVLPVLNTFMKFHVRLVGIDSCELKSKNEKNRELAYKARARLFELIFDTEIDVNIRKKDMAAMFDIEMKIVWIKCFKFDKYGRLLGVVSKDRDSKSFGDILLEEGLAYKYDGKRKLTEAEQQAILFQ